MLGLVRFWINKVLYKLDSINQLSNPISYIKLFLSDVKVLGKLKIQGPITISKSPKSQIVIGQNVFIQSSKRKYALGIFAPTKLVTVYPSARIVIGDNCDLNGVTITCRSTSICIGNNVLIAANTIITDSDWHNILPIDKRMREYCRFVQTDKSVLIDEFVWIGLNCIILKGVKIGRGSVIAAGSVVVNDIPPMVVAGGVPAKVIRKIEDK